MSRVSWEKGQERVLHALLIEQELNKSYGTIAMPHRKRKIGLY